MGSEDPSVPRRVRFEQAFHAHYSELCNFATRYVDARAEDIVQSVFVRLWELSEDGDSHRLTRLYLYRSTRNRCLQERRHDRVKEGTGRSDVQLLADFEDVHENIEREELAAIVSRAIAALPERMRAVLLLRRDHGLKNAEIAEVMDISVSTVEVQMWKALKALRAAVGPYLAITVLVASQISSVFFS